MRAATRGTSNTTIELCNNFCFIDLMTTDAAASREYYAKLFGWTFDTPDATWRAPGCSTTSAL